MLKYDLAPHSAEANKFSLVFEENPLVEIIIFTHAYPRGNKTELYMYSEYIAIINLPISAFEIVTKNQKDI